MAMRGRVLLILETLETLALFLLVSLGKSQILVAASVEVQSQYANITSIGRRALLQQDGRKYVVTSAPFASWVYLMNHRASELRDRRSHGGAKGRRETLRKIWPCTRRPFLITAVQAVAPAGQQEERLDKTISLEEAPVVP